MVKILGRAFFELKPITGFLEKSTQTEQFIAEVKKQKCPACNQQRLEPTTIEIGAKGWEARTYCMNCGTKSVFNDTGFHVEIFFKNEAKK